MTTERASPPIVGMWVVSSQTHELTPEIVEAVRDGLEQAAKEGKQVIVLEGIEFAWRPTPLDDSPLDVERLARALIEDEKWTGIDERHDFGDFVNLITARQYAKHLIAILDRLDEDKPA